MDPALLAAVVDTAACLICVCDRHGRVVQVNRACEETSGWALSEVRGRVLDELLVPPDQLSAAASVRERIRAGERPVRHEHHWQTRDGRVRLIDWTSTAILAEDGQVEYVVSTGIDVTDRRAAERALARSEERFRALFDSAVIGIGVFDPEGQPLARNAAYRRLLGYSEEELADLPAGAVIHPEDRPAAEAFFRELALGQRDSGRTEHRCLRKDGGVVSVVVTASLVRDDEGRPRFLVGTFEDVTEVRRAEAALRESEERFRTLFDSAPIGIGLFDLDGHTIARNAAYEQMLGFSAEELATMPAAGFVHPEDLDETLAHFRELASGQRERDYLEYRCVRKDGTIGWMLLNGAAVRDAAGRPLFIVAALQDATELRLTNVALRKSEERYRELVENANDLIYTHDLDGTFTSLNRAAERVSGYLREEALGKRVFDLVAPEYRRVAADMIERKLSGESERTVYELEILAKAGYRVPLEVSSRLILEEGVPVGVQGIARDITERRRAEALAHAQRRVLEAIARGAPLPEVLKELALLVEELAPGRLCTIRLYDPERNRLALVAAPSLPPSFEATLEQAGGLLVGPWAGSCGTAAHRLEPVFTLDTETDPLWEGLREVVRRFGIRAAWSTPILGTDGSLLGTLALHWSDPVEPEPEEVELVGIAAHIASIAVLRSQAEARLAAAEQRYRFLAEQLPIVTYVDRLDAQSSTIYVSPQVEELLGYSPEEWRADPGLFTKLLHPDDRERMLAQIAERNATGEPSTSEYRLIARDGRVVWLREAEVVARDADGNPLYAQGYLLDVTDEKAADARLAEAEERYRLLAERLPLITYVDDLDAAKPLRYVSPQAAELLGYPLEDWLNDPAMLRRVAHPDDREQVDAALVARNATGEPFRGDFRALTAHGRIVWLQVGESLIRDECGRPLHAQGYLVDITELKEAEQGLRESEERFRQLAENVDQVFWLVEPAESRTLYLSPAFESVWGRSSGELLADAGVFPTTIHPADRDRVMAALARSAEEDLDLQYRIVRPDGEVRWIRDRSFRVRDEQGNVTRVAGIAVDITERKREGEARRQLEEQMRHVQKLESLGVLAGGIAHDFNNLLMGVLGHAGLALAELPADSPVRDQVSRIETAALRAAELTNQMLAYAGKGRFVVAPLDLSCLVQEMTHLLGAAISKMAVLRFELDPDLPSVEGDATQLRQVVMNLITNASDALAEDTGVITVRTGVAELDRAYLATTYLNENLPDGTYVFVEVEDTGCGMDERTLGRIFDPFFTTKFTGRGLGLAGVLGIVRAHSGAIRVTSKPGFGTTIRVALPVAGAAAGKETPAETPAVGFPALAGTVLVVDDEEVVRTVARATLERAGFTVLTAVDGLEALDVFHERADEISVVVVDLTMPVMTGRELLTELHAIRPDTRVVLSSGYTEEDTAQRLDGARVAGFIQKPYRPAELVEKLRTVIES